MKLLAIVKVLSSILAFLGAAVLVPALYSILQDNDQLSVVLILIGFSTVAAGSLTWNLLRHVKTMINHRSGFAIVTLAWILAGFVGALPYYFGALTPNFIDALFESVSGFSGTGASILTNVELTPKPLLLWRSITQWLGGMGIIIFFIAILPFLGVGSVQLFKAETMGPQKDKVTPRARETAKRLWGVYTFFTVVLTMLLYFAGMDWFDAINHALTTCATGGFSTRNLGVASFDNPAIEYIIAFFMCVAAINFGIYYKVLIEGNYKAIFDTELKGFIVILSLAIAALTLSLVTWPGSQGLFESGEEAFRVGFFTVAATISSTGFTYQDYTLWSPFAWFLLMILMTMGGMSGSTAGGIKCVRIIAAIKQIEKELVQIVHPKAVLGIKSNHHNLPSKVVSSISGFIALYFLTAIMASSLLLLFCHMDILSAVTAVVSCLSNIGPAFGNVGPYDNYAALTTFAKSILVICMILGRLEFFTVLVLFTRIYWRN